MRDRSTAGIASGVIAGLAALLVACGSVEVAPDDDASPDATASPDAAPGSPDAKPTPPPPGTPDAAPAPPPKVTRWYRNADGVEHEGPVPGSLVGDVDPPASFLRAGCVVADYCDSPNAVVGTLCHWTDTQACTRPQAWAQCEEIVKSKSCVVHYPEVLYL
jgi:hypothetical protein